ncbi:hypothetical protein [Leucobacter sp. USHLN153]|uniref:hypothetical protein n=1 Tax=Leucobacter sp. USHLN153 TaxID=3081268 RepID=UPI0030168E8A
MNQPDLSSASTPLGSASAAAGAGAAAGRPVSSSEPLHAPADVNAVREPAVPEPAAAAPAAPEPIVRESKQEVILERSVRVNRVLIAGVVIGAVVAMLACLFFPIAEDAEYTMGQIVGFMALIGAALGAGVAGLLVIVLGAVARRKRGTGIAVQSDVR